MSDPVAHDDESAATDPEEAPQEAEPDEVPDSDRPKRRNINHTIASLKLNMAAANEGKFWLLLPWEVRRQTDGAERYPLPSYPAELAQVAALEIRRGVRDNSGATYIWQCRERLKRRAINLK